MVRRGHRGPGLKTDARNVTVRLPVADIQDLDTIALHLRTSRAETMRRLVQRCKGDLLSAVAPPIFDAHENDAAA